MRNPVVVTKTGRTYEKAAIEAWITLNHAEPYDRNVALEDFTAECSSNTAMYALIEHFVRSVRTMQPGALLDGTVAQRMKRAAAKTTVVIVEKNIHVFKKQASLSGGASSNAHAALTTLEKGLIPDVPKPKKEEEVDVVGELVFPEELPERAYIHVKSLEFPDKSKPTDGRFFRFDMDELTRVIGHSWANEDVEAYRTEKFSVKTGKGATFCTYRDEKRSAIVVFGGPDGMGVGCYHPVSSAQPGDWAVGEPIELTAYRGIPKGLRFMNPDKISSIKFRYYMDGDERVLNSGMNGERPEQIFPGQSGIYPLNCKYKGTRIYNWLHIEFKLEYPTGTDPELINGRPITPIGVFVDNRLLLQRGGCAQIYNCRDNELHHCTANGDGPSFRSGMQTDNENLQHFGAMMLHRDRMYEPITDFMMNFRMPDNGPMGVPCFSEECGGGLHFGFLEGDPAWWKVGKNEWPTSEEGNVGATCDDDASKWGDKALKGPNAKESDEFFVYDPRKKAPKPKRRTYKTDSGATMVTKVKSDTFVFPRQRRKLVDPHLEVVSLDYPGGVMQGKTDPEPKGKWFRFKSDQLSEICGISDWGNGCYDGWKTGIIKSGDGASFSVADRDRGIIVFQHESGLGVGCSNPCDYAREGEWSVGDRLQLLAYSHENQPPPYTFALSIDEYICQTETGWNLPGHLIRFGQCGLVGGWWKEMEIEFKIEEASVGTRIYGVHTDASFESLPFTATALRSDGEWHDIELSEDDVPWGRAFASVMDDVSAVRVRWDSTDLHKLANSTARSGGGIHANLLGTSTAFNVLDVRHSGHPVDGSIFRFDKDAIRAATCNASNWQGRYEVLNLRSGKKGAVMLLDKADQKVLAAYSKAMQQKAEPIAIPASATVAPPSVVVVDTPGVKSAPLQARHPPPKGPTGFLSCCFSAPAPVASAHVDEPAATTMVVYKDVYIDEASPVKSEKLAPTQMSAAVDVLGFGYWLDAAQTPALAPGDWQIGDIIMLARRDLDVDDFAPSVLEDGTAGVAALERVKSIDAAGAWANIRFISSDDVAQITLPSI